MFSPNYHLEDIERVHLRLYQLLFYTIMSAPKLSTVSSPQWLPITTLYPTKKGGKWRKRNNWQHRPFWIDIKSPPSLLQYVLSLNAFLYYSTASLVLIWKTVLEESWFQWLADPCVLNKASGIKFVFTRKITYLVCFTRERPNIWKWHF